MVAHSCRGYSPSGRAGGAMGTVRGTERWLAILSPTESKPRSNRKWASIEGTKAHLE